MDYDFAPLPPSDKRNSGTTTPVEGLESSGPLYPPRSLAPPPAKLNEVLMSRRAWTPTFLPPTVRLFFIGAIVSTSGFLYGFDTGSIGPITQMSQFSDTVGDLSSSLQGFFVASILLSASASSLASGVVAEKISRRYGIAVGAAIFALASAVCAAGQSFAMMQVARLITGIGAGQMISVASIYLVEIAPAQARGKLVCMLQFAITVGLMTGYFLCYGTSMINSSMQWRLPFALSAVLSLALCFATLFLVPFSPRWLAQNGCEDQALSTLRQLRLSAHSGRHHRPGRYGAEDELLLLELDGIKAAIAESRRLNASSASFRELFNRRYRSRSLLGITLMAFQQLSGVDVILYFAPIVFASVFTSQEGAFLASGGLGIVAVLATIPAQIWADHWGRKPPMVAGGLSMATCYIVIGSLFARFGQQTSSGVRLTGGNAKWVVVVGIYAFLAFFSCTWAVATRIYASEIMPTKLRSRAAALQQLANWTTNFLVALTAPSFLKATPSGPYFFFASTLLIASGICVVFMRETKGKSLEAITEMFELRAA